MHKRIHLIPVFILITIPILFCQSSQETIKYANDLFSKSVSEFYKYEISSLYNNEITIKRYRLAQWENSKVDLIKFRLSDINTNIYISKDMETCSGSKYRNTGGKHIQIWCRNKSDCILDPQHTPKYTCSLSLFLDIPDYDYQRLNNALKHLVSINQTGQIQTTINDPFAPKNKEPQSNINRSKLTSKPNCNIETTRRPDGETIRYINPELAGKSGSMELGLSVQTNGRDYFLSTVVRSTGIKYKIKNNLFAELTNGESISLSISRSEIAYVNNEEVRLAIFEMTLSDQLKLQNNNISKVILQESTGKYLIFSISKHSIVKQHLNCLK